jgi:hypothetical protein
MAKRSRQTFQKQQKAQARRQKQEQKAARRLQAKQRRAAVPPERGEALVAMADRRPDPLPAPAPGDRVNVPT